MMVPDVGGFGGEGGVVEATMVGRQQSRVPGALIKDLGLNVLGVVRYVGSGIHGLLGSQIAAVTNFFSAMKVVGVVDVPFAVYGLGEAIHDGATSKQWQDKADAGLIAIAQVGSLIDAGLSAPVGVMAIQALKKGVAFAMPLWATVMGLAGATFKLGALAVNSFGLYRTYKLRKGMVVEKDAEGKSTQESVVKALEFLLTDQKTGVSRNEREFAKRLKVANGALLKAHVVEALARIQMGQANSVEEGARLIESLRGRATKNMKNHALKITAQVVGIIGLVVLLAVPVVAPLGYALLAIGGGLQIYQAAWERRTFKKPYLSVDNELEMKEMKPTKTRDPLVSSLDLQTLWYITERLRKPNIIDLSLPKRVEDAVATV